MILKIIFINKMSDLCTFEVYEGNLINCTFKNTAVTCENFQTEFISQLQQKLDDANPFTLFVDTTNLQTVPMSVCYNVIKFMRDNREKIRLYMLASAIIIESDLIRNLLGYVFSISPPVSKNLLTSDHQEGINFVEAYMPK